jgi:hypothetical protein
MQCSQKLKIEERAQDNYQTFVLMPDSDEEGEEMMDKQY